MDCRKEKNLAGCTCTYDPCSRKGICCECVENDCTRITRSMLRGERA